MLTRAGIIAAAGGAEWSGNIRTEGDSVMNGAYGVATKTKLAALLPGLEHTNTAVGGSTIDDQYGRIIDPTNASLLSRTLIWLDGSQNGIMSVEEYVDTIAQGAAYHQHGKFVLIPAILPYGGTYAGSQAEAIYQEMISRWPDNVLDWRDWLANTNGSIAAGEFYDHTTDVWHLSDSGASHLALGIYNFLVEKGWVDSDATDPLLTNGSMWLFDPALAAGAFAGTPAHNDVLPNIAWQRAAGTIGAGDATSLGTHVAVTDTNEGADLFAERTDKNGLHVILSQDSAYVNTNAQGYDIRPHELIQNYLDDHVDDDWYFGLWFAVTRAPIDPPGGTPPTNGAPQSVMHKADNTSNFLFHMQNLGTAPISSVEKHLGSLKLPSAQAYSAITPGAPLLRAVGASGHTGTKPEMGDWPNNNNGLHVILGSGDAWGYFNNGAAPSLVLYRAYAENLTVSGRTFAQVSAMDRVLYEAAFGEDGRFAGDSYTDPATLP